MPGKKESGYRKVLRKIAHYEVANPYMVLITIIAITIIFAAGYSNVKTVAALENMMPGSIEEIRAFNEIRDANRGQDMVAAVIKLDPDSTLQENHDILDYKYYKYVKDLSDKLLEENNIISVYSLSTVLEAINGKPLSEEEYNIVIKDQSIKDYVDDYVNPSRTNTIVIATTDVSANDDLMVLLAERINEDIKSEGRPPDTKIGITGTPIIQQRLGELIGSDRKLTQNISTFFVFIIVMFLFGTFTSALVPIIIVSLSVTWLYGTMGFFNIPISTLAGGVAAMVIGIGIDYAIHLINKYKFERRKGLDRKQSIEEAVTDTGTALTGASVATIAAFLAFLLGSMPEMNRFGLLMSLGVGYSFLLSILALPALLIIEEDIFFKLRKHLHFGVEGEFFLASNNEVCPPGFRAKEIKSKEEALKLASEIIKKYKVYEKKDPQKKHKKRREGV